MNGLPRFWHAVFRSERFKRVTDDRFFLSVDAKDPKYDAGKTREFLETLGGTAVESLSEEGDNDA